MNNISEIDDRFNIYKNNTVVLLKKDIINQHLIKLLKDNNIKIDYICDFDKKNWGNAINNIPVISPRYLKHMVKSNYFGDNVVAQVSSKSIDLQLVKLITSFGISKIINLNDALKKSNYNSPQEQILHKKPEFKDIKKRYTDSLRGLNNDKFSLLSPEDMPEDAKELVKKLEYLKHSYLAGENFYIDKEKTMLLQDFCSRGYMNNGVRRIGGYQSGLLRTEFLYNNIDPIIEEKTIQNISNFSNYLSNKNISFLYMQIPCKLSPNGDNLPEGISNETNFRATRLLQGINKNNVNTLDYRKIMVDNNINFNESFFKTDHHWKPKTVFEATSSLCCEIEKLISINLDKEKLNINNYNIINYKSMFLGNCGKESDILYSGLDDFDLILPKYDTNYSWNCVKNNFNKQGTAQEALIYPLQIDWKYYEANPYAAYSLTHNGYNIIKNHNSNNDKKILLLNDSFSNPLASFLAPQFAELHFLDLRGEKKDVIGIIEKVKPNIVVMLYSTFTIFKFNIHRLFDDIKS